jgi:DNA-binding transcriptional regulator GbsR (MarR family)
MTDRDRLDEMAEEFALQLAQGGMQKATARVLAALVFTEQDTTTAADLGQQLMMSAGAVSTAVRQLQPLGMIERVPAPGSRRDHFRLREHAWATLMIGQHSMLKVMEKVAADGLVLAGKDSATGQRLEEMQDFYRFMGTELPALVDRWRDGRRG